jgi:hypothetical protein
MVQFPVGKPFNIMLPVAIAQVGCVMVPVMGAGGIAAVIITFADAGEVHPAAFVTVKEYVPAVNPVIVVLAVFPAIAPGLIVQLPAGRLLITTLPVANTQLGFVIAPIVGAGGVTGWEMITKFADCTEVHPAAFVTV